MWAIHHDPECWDKPDLFNPGETQKCLQSASTLVH